jgi:phosphate-selective porin OprO/OprP
VAPRPLPAESTATTPEGSPVRIPVAVRLARPSFPTSAPPPVPEGRDDTFLLESLSSSAALRLGGYIQLDGRHFEGDKISGSIDGFVVRRLRPIMAGAVGQNLSFRFMPDLANGQVNVFDAYFDLGPRPIRLLFGKFKEPFGLEQLMNDINLPLIERGLPTELTPSRDTGVQIHGEPFGQKLRYALGVFNGGADNTLIDGDVDHSKDLAAHVFAHPLQGIGVPLLDWLGIGVAATRGGRGGNAKTPLLPAYRSPGQQTFFHYRGDGKDDATSVSAQGIAARFTAHGYWYYQRVGLLGEYVVTRQDVALGSQNKQLSHHAWQGIASVALTDDRVAFDGVVPQRRVGDGGIGALVLAGRYSELRVDERAFPIYADPKNSATRARSFAADLAWVLDTHTRIQIEQTFTSFLGPKEAAAPTPRERTLFGRLQGRF